MGTKRKWTQKNTVFLLLILLAVFFFLNGVSSEVRSVFAEATWPVRAGFWNAGTWIAKQAEAFTSGELLQERDQLREENLKLQQTIAELKDQMGLSQEQEEVLQFQTESPWSTISAQIVGKKRDEEILFLRPLEKGVREGMPVITASSVAVGSVDSVSDSLVSVRLLSHLNASVDGKVEGKEILGLVRGGFPLAFDLVPLGKNMEEGDIVVTSALSREFPENLLIGRINGITKTDTDAFQKASLDPFFDLAEQETLLIVTSF